MTPITFVFLAFGNNIKNHAMANFSMLSLKKFAPAQSKIVIYTDKPEYYAYLSSIVETRMLDQNKINEWQGKHKFVWRIKIMALLDSAEKDPGHLLYVDADTFALKDLRSLTEKLDQDFCFMHLRESRLCEDKAENKMRMWQQTQNKTYGGVVVNKDSYMWNAGLVGFSEKSKVALLTRALASTDEMCEAKVEQWLIEQFSLSQSLAASGKLLPCDEWFAHYWAFKEKLFQAINTFLSQCLQQNFSIENSAMAINVREWEGLLVSPPKKSWWHKLLSK